MQRIDEARSRDIALEKEHYPNHVATTEDGIPLGDLRSHEVMDIQRRVDAFGGDVFVVGSAAKGERRHVGTDRPLDTGDPNIPKKDTRSDVDYIVPTGRGEAADRLGLPDPDGKLGVLETDYINMSDATKGGRPGPTPTPAIKFSPGKPPEYFSRDAGHIPLNEAGIANLKRKGLAAHPETTKRIAEMEKPVSEKTLGAEVTPTKAGDATIGTHGHGKGAEPCATCGPVAPVKGLWGDGMKGGLLEFARKPKSPLFAEGGPKPKDVAQGALGDCYLLSTMQSLAKQHPHLIERMIKANADATYTVTFKQPSIKTVDADGNVSWSRAKDLPVTVTDAIPHTFGIDPAYARPKDAKWMAIVEKAYAKEFGGGKGYAGIGKGGHPYETMKQLGFEADLYSTQGNFNYFKQHHDNGGLLVARTPPDPKRNMWEKMTDLFKKSEEPKPFGGHAWSVQDLYHGPNGTQMIDVFNPHNSSGKYGGEFSLPYADFSKMFPTMDLGERL